jgi:hypothetical protein
LFRRVIVSLDFAQTAVLVEQAVAVLVNAVALVEHANLRAAERAAAEAPEHAHAVVRWLVQLEATQARLSADVVDRAVAVVVEAVADLGTTSAEERRGTAAPLTVDARRLPAVPAPVLIVFAAVRENLLVHPPVAIVVPPVAEIFEQLDALATGVQHALVRLKVAVVIAAVADLASYGAAPAARVLNALVDAPVAVVVA